MFPFCRVPIPSITLWTVQFDSTSSQWTRLMISVVFSIRLFTLSKNIIFLKIIVKWDDLFDEKVSNEDFYLHRSRHTEPFSIIFHSSVSFIALCRHHHAPFIEIASFPLPEAKSCVLKKSRHVFNFFLLFCRLKLIFLLSMPSGLTHGEREAKQINLLTMTFVVELKILNFQLLMLLKC